MEHADSSFYVIIHKKVGVPIAISFESNLEKAKAAPVKKVNLEQTKVKNESIFADLFARTVASLEVRRSLDGIISFLGSSVLQIPSEVHFDPAMDKFGKLENNDDERKIFRVDMARNEDIRSALRHTIRGVKALRQLPELFIIGLVGDYDVFLGDLIKAGLEIQPTWLGGAEKTLRLKDLDQFTSIEEARDFFVEREIDSIFIQDHLEQLREVSKIFNAKIDLEDQTVKAFLEVCERRNLFAHTGGIVSAKYVRKCKALGISPAGKQGTRLKATKQYLTDSVSIVYELCIKLCHFIWRKLVPAEEELADEQLNRVSFDLIRFGDHKVAERILDYAIYHTKPATDILRRKMFINYTTAIKLSGDKSRACIELGKLDWTATGNAFKIFVAAINDDVDGVLKLMRPAATAGDVNVSEFETSPVFEDLRGQSSFQDRFREIFGKELIPGANLPSGPVLSA